MGNLFVSAYGRSNVGKKRNNNEDNFYLSGVTVDSANDITAVCEKTSKIAFSVFDGMGGEAAGEKASQITAVTFGENLVEIMDSDFSQAVLQNTVDAANKKVCDEMRVIGRRMGCTFVSFGFSDDVLHICNVGDSRAYLLRNGSISCISKDHTVAQTMVDSGMISYEASQKNKEKHKLTQHIGIFPEEMIIEPHFQSLQAEENDVILLCSDGLTDMLSDEEIRNVLQANGSTEEKANALVESALAKGGKDNVTVIVADVCTENCAATTKTKRKYAGIIACAGAVLVLCAICAAVFFAVSNRKNFSWDLDWFKKIIPTKQTTQTVNQTTQSAQTTQQSPTTPIIPEKQTVSET